jgi:hypothetical protein
MYTTMIPGAAIEIDGILELNFHSRVLKVENGVLQGRGRIYVYDIFPKWN